MEKCISSINSSVTYEQMWEQVGKFRGDYWSYTTPLQIQAHKQHYKSRLTYLVNTFLISLNYSKEFLKDKQSAKQQKLPTTGASNELYNTPLTQQELNSPFCG